MNGSIAHLPPTPNHPLAHPFHNRDHPAPSATRSYSADTEFALVCGPLLREALAYLEVARRVLTTPRLFEPFLSYVRHEAFDVAADAFASLRCLLTRHPELVAPFLEQSYDHVGMRDVVASSSLVAAFVNIWAFFCLDYYRCWLLSDRFLLLTFLFLFRDWWLAGLFLGTKK